MFKDCFLFIPLHSRLETAEEIGCNIQTENDFDILFEIILDLIKFVLFYRILVKTINFSWIKREKSQMLALIDVKNGSISSLVTGSKDKI